MLNKAKNQNQSQRSIPPKQINTDFGEELGGLGKSALGAVVSEPAKIGEELAEQIIGGKSQNTQNQPKYEEQGFLEKEAKDKARSARHAQAYRRELQDMEEQKSYEVAQAKMLGQQEEEQKQEKTEEQKKTVLVEPETKKKRGIFGGILGALKRKQRGTELGKTPTG